MDTDQWNRGKLLEISSHYWQTCTLHAGVQLRIFTVLADAAMTADAVAAGLNTDLRATTMLLNGLAAMGLLRKSRASYDNSPTAQEMLVEGAPGYLGHIIGHHHHLVDGWTQLARAVTNGRPVSMHSFGEETERRNFLMGMFDLAKGIAPQVADAIELDGRRRLLDLGGGPGTYAIHFCRANPELTATIFDRPTTRPYAENMVKQFNLNDRIDFMAGDFNQDPLPNNFDAAWLSHILHSNGEDDCCRLIAKTVAALKPGGLIMVHEFFLDNTMTSPLFPALFSLNMLLNNPTGRSYSEEEIRLMLADAGVRDIRRLDFVGPNDSGILIGTV